MLNNIEINKIDKKLKKYIESYSYLNSISNKFIIKSDVCTYILINNESSFSLEINANKYDIKKNEVYLISASINDIELNSPSSFDFILVKFKAARVGFFYDNYMNDLEENIILLEREILDFKSLFINKDFNIILDEYLKDKFEVLAIPFNIQKIIDLVDENRGTYTIEEVLLKANIPRRIFLKIFTKYMTLSLKTYAKVIELKYK